MTEKVDIEKRQKMLNEIFDKKKSGKKLTEVESAVFDFATKAGRVPEAVKEVLGDLLQQLVDADEARAVARREAQKHRDGVLARLDELRQVNEKYRTENAVQVAQKLADLGVLNDDFTYKVDAAHFNAVVREHFKPAAPAAPAPAHAPAGALNQQREQQAPAGSLSQLKSGVRE